TLVSFVSQAARAMAAASTAIVKAAFMSWPSLPIQGSRRWPSSWPPVPPGEAGILSTTLRMLTERTGNPIFHGSLASEKQQTMPRNPRKSVAYYRTSSATNVGPDKDSLPRQQAAVRAYAKHAKLEIVEEFYDAAVRGADAIDQRPGFTALL